MGEERDFTTEDQLIRILSSNADEEECPIQRALELLGGKWRTHIIYELCIKPCRFGELKKAIPKITSTMLTATLRDLEHIGIIHREQFNEIPPHVEYSLTEKGRALIPAFYELTKWGEKYLDEEAFSVDAE